MQHSDPGVAKTTLHPPTRADPPQCRPFSKSALSIGRYIDLDDFPSSTDHVHNDLGHVTSSKKKRVYLRSKHIMDTVVWYHGDPRNPGYRWDREVSA
jgi:hypothetical protein